MFFRPGHPGRGGAGGGGCCRAARSQRQRGGSAGTAARSVRRSGGDAGHVFPLLRTRSEERCRSADFAVVDDRVVSVPLLYHRCRSSSRTGGVGERARATASAWGPPLCCRGRQAGASAPGQREVTSGWGRRGRSACGATEGAASRRWSGGRFTLGGGVGERGGGSVTTLDLLGRGNSNDCTSAPSCHVCAVNRSGLTSRSARPVRRSRGLPSWWILRGSRAGRARPPRREERRRSCLAVAACSLSSADK